MKSNRNTSIVCGVLVVVSGTGHIILELFLSKSAIYSAIQGVISGVFTGFIVSLVVSLIGYFNERNVIIEKINNHIKQLYFNMAVLSKTIGNTLSQILNANELPILFFKNICGLSELNIDFLEKMDLGLFAPFYKKEKYSSICAQLKEFEQINNNIKNISTNLEIQALEYNLKFLEIQQNQLKGIQTNINEIKLLDEKKNLINIKTAKLHEYTMLETIELDKIAKYFYDCKGNKDSWIKIKSDLLSQVDYIVKG